MAEWRHTKTWHRPMFYRYLAAAGSSGRFTWNRYGFGRNRVTIGAAVRIGCRVYAVKWAYAGLVRDGGDDRG